MTRLFATGLIGAALLLGGAAFAADAPKSVAQAGPEWFPHFMELCKQHGLKEADCRQRYEQRKQAVLEICKREGIKGEEGCRQWMEQQRADIAEQRKALCKENGVEGDEACARWIERRRLEAMDAFQTQCKRDGLNEDQCQQRYNKMVEKWQQENEQFMKACAAKGGSRVDCMRQLREKRRAERAQSMQKAPAAKAPAKPEKGTALPPPQ